jgi:hypothetical protein
VGRAANLRSHRRGRAAAWRARRPPTPLSKTRPLPCTIRPGSGQLVGHASTFFTSAVRATCGQKQEAAATTALAFSLHGDATMTCYILRLSPEVLEVICGYLKNVPEGHNILVRLLCTSKAWKVCSQPPQR